MKMREQEQEGMQELNKLKAHRVACLEVAQAAEVLAKAERALARQLLALIKLSERLNTMQPERARRLLAAGWGETELDKVNRAGARVNEAITALMEAAERWGETMQELAEMHLGAEGDSEVKDER